MRGNTRNGPHLGAEHVTGLAPFLQVANYGIEARQLSPVVPRDAHTRKNLFHELNTHNAQAIH